MLVDFKQVPLGRYGICRSDNSPQDWTRQLWPASSLEIEQVAGSYGPAAAVRRTREVGAASSARHTSDVPSLPVAVRGQNAWDPSKS